MATITRSGVYATNYHEVNNQFVGVVTNITVGPYKMIPKEASEGQIDLRYYKAIIQHVDRMSDINKQLAKNADNQFWNGLGMGLSIASMIFALAIMIRSFRK